MYAALKDAAVQAKNDGEIPAEDAQTYIRSGKYYLVLLSRCMLYV